MVRHIVCWNFVDTLSKEEKKEAGLKMKEILKSLKDVIPGVISLDVVINEMETSNRDIMLIADYESEEALKGYIVHPAHVEAGKYVRSVTCDRAGFDYEL